MHVSEPQETRPLRVGEVAKATGLTVRTLHHYDEIGLLVPSERSGAGYRLYSHGDVRRLYRILALRGMGFTLEEIGRTLVGEGEDPRPAVRRHLERIDEQLRLAGQLRTRLTRILDVLDRADEPSGDQFIDAIEVMTRMERYYTPEQLEQLQERADALGPEGMERAQEAWATLIAEVEAERVAGTDPADPRLDPLVERWSALVRQFTGGDPGIKASLQERYDTEGSERASHGALQAETMAYAGKAMAARGGGQAA
jgi:DNA-binding transcriptional MerR regulator